MSQIVIKIFPTLPPLAVGDDTGRLEILEIYEQYHTPKPEEWSKFMQTINELTQSALEERRSEAGNVSTFGSRHAYSSSRLGGSSHRFAAGDYWSLRILGDF